MNLLHHLRHGCAAALVRGARALERAYIAHGTRMAQTGGLELP